MSRGRIPKHPIQVASGSGLAAVPTRTVMPARAHHSGQTVRPSPVCPCRPRLASRAAMIGLILSVMLAGVPQSASAAQDAGPLGVPITPAPAECTVAPRSVPDLVRLGGQPATPPAENVEVASTEPIAAPAGVPADPGTTADVAAVVRHYIACLNGLDTSRSFALFTDRYLAETLADFGPLPGLTLSPTGAPFAIPEPAWRSFAVASVTILPDGRAAAAVNVLVPGTGDGFTPGTITAVTYVLAPVAGDWRIDETIVDAANRANEIVAGTGFIGVVFNVPAAEELVAYFGDIGRYDGFWYPTRRHIVALEAALPAYLASQSSPLADRVADEEYLRQYAGVIQDGKPVILVNAFCDAEGTGWIEAPYIVLDGGTCYFSVRYDVAAGTLFDLRINGEA